MSMLLSTVGSTPPSRGGAASTGDGSSLAGTGSSFADALADAVTSRGGAADPGLEAGSTTAAGDDPDAPTRDSDDRPAEPGRSPGPDAAAFLTGAATANPTPVSVALAAGITPAVGADVSLTASVPVGVPAAGESPAATASPAAGQIDGRHAVGAPSARPLVEGHTSSSADRGTPAPVAPVGVESPSEGAVTEAVTTGTPAETPLPMSAWRGVAVVSTPVGAATAASPATGVAAESTQAARVPPAVPASPAPLLGSAPAGTPEAADPAGIVVTGPAPVVAPADAPTRHEAAPPAATTATGSTGVAVTAPVPASVPLSSAPGEAAAPTVAPRSLAAQVAPAIVHIAQRPTGTHQITVTVAPEATGPVTVRAHIGPGGEVRIDLAGATEAGRDALRALVGDLRRDLAAVIPHAHLSVGSALTADAGTGDRGASGGMGSDPSDARRGSRSDDTAPPASARPTARLPPAPSTAVAGGGLDILV